MSVKGTVGWFNDKKGYGFITGEDEKDVFVHQSAIQASGFRTLKEGQKVEFDVVPGPKGEQAKDVKVLDDAGQSTHEKIRAFKKDSRERERDLKKRRDRK